MKLLGRSEGKEEDEVACIDHDDDREKGSS